MNKRRQRQTATMNPDSFQADPPRPSIPRAELPPGPSELPVIGQAFRLRNDLIGLLEEVLDVLRLILDRLKQKAGNEPAVVKE